MAEEPMSQAKQVRGIYSIMNGIENNIGGGEGIEGLYGSITGTHMQRMFAVMRERCGFDTASHLVDIGSGLGRPLLHALVTEGISGATGIELDFIKCMKAEAFLKQTANTMLKRGFVSHAVELPVIECKPVEKVRSLDPATHAYSFWEGVPIDARVAFGRLFAGSKTLRSVTVVQRSMRLEDPEEVMEHGYAFGPVNLVETLSVSMSGSNRHFTAYVFNKSEPPAALPRRRGARAAIAAAAAAEGAEEGFEKVATPSLSGDNAKLGNKTDDSALDAVSKKLELAEVEVASPAAAARSNRSGSGSGKSRNKKRAGSSSNKRKEMEFEEEAETTNITTRRNAASSPQEKPKPAPTSDRISPRKEKNSLNSKQQQRPLLAALASTRRGRVMKHPQGPQHKQHEKGNTTVTAVGGSKQSPKELMGRESRGLLGGDGSGSGGGLFNAAELLEGSSYPRTRHAVSLVSYDF